MSEKKPVRPVPVREVKVIEVVRTISMVGLGVSDDPVRNVTQYWSLAGELLATNDPCGDGSPK